MFALTLLASAINYGSSVVFSRILTPASFGDFTALLALAVVLAVPTAAGQTVIAARVAAHVAAGRHEQMRYLTRHALAHVTVLGLAAATIYVLLIPVIAQVLNLQTIGPAIALSPLIGLAFVQPIVLGLLQGMDRYLAFGGMLLTLAVLRTLVGVPAALVTGGAGGAIAGQALAMLAGLALGAWLLRGSLIRRGTGAATSGLRRKPNVRTVSASAAFVAFAVLSNVDVLLAKLFLNPTDVGLYAALLTLGKFVTFLPASIAVVMVPSAARARDSAGATNRVLRISALLVAGSTLMAALPAALAPDLTIRLLFGTEYLRATPGVLPIVIAGAGLAMLYLLVVYSVAIEDRRWVVLLVCGTFLQAVGIAAFHDSPAQVATVQAAVVLVLLLANEAAFHSLLRPRTRRRPA